MQTPTARLRELVSRLPARFQWTIHNVIGHPVSEVAHQLGMPVLSEFVHDATMPNTVRPGPPILVRAEPVRLLEA
tara:strand:- start:278 stop:502 length:225 start_codon:yes stop_codon:yes gene_type:complete